jgi:hypothetical protein
MSLPHDTNSRLINVHRPFTSHFIQHYICIVTCFSDSQQGFRLDTGFMDHLQVVTTNNCNTIANFYTLQITTAHAKPFQSAASSPVVSWQWILTT